MIDLIVFSVGNNHYALNIENVQRIIQAEELTAIPNSNDLIDGMMSHEGSVIKVLNFRKLIGLIPYDRELQKLFVTLKKTHQDWMEALTDSIENGSEFINTTNPHKCELGIWLDNFNSYDDKVTSVLKNLILSHKYLHISGGDALELYQTDKEKAKDMLKTNIHNTYNKTMNDLDIFISELDRVSSSLQKLILYEKNGKSFAIKVDNIKDIVHVEEIEIMSNSDESSESEYLELAGLLDIGDVLINVINSVQIPSSKALK